MATSSGLSDYEYEDTSLEYTQKELQDAVAGAGYFDNFDTPVEFSDEGALAKLEQDLMNDTLMRDILGEEEALGKRNLANMTSPKKVVLYGDDAINRVQELEGRELSFAEKVVVKEEGFVNVPYEDTKGITTYGVGQTGEWIDKSFGEAFDAHKEEARRMIPSFDNLSEELQGALMSAVYRGDLQNSKKFRKLFNAGKFKKASVEFLDNADYRRSVKVGDGVHGRMERIANIVKDTSVEYTQADLQDAVTGAGYFDAPAELSEGAA